MRDYIHIGSTPIEEDCQQVGPTYDPIRAREECRAFIAQLERTFGPPPGSARLRIKHNAHDFGSYCEVICEYDDMDEEAYEYAMRCENDTPVQWDAAAREALGLKGVR